MNSFQALRLIYEIYFKKGLPNLRYIESLGLLAVKIGQIHALRLDFLSEQKCQKLSELYRHNLPVAYDDVEILFEEFGGKGFVDNFKEIEKKPIATASVGQVHLATLKNGDRVIIKVIKKKVKDKFEKDVRKLRKFFKLALKLSPKLKGVGNPIGILDDIERYTLAELDLQNEIKGTIELENQYRKYKRSFDLSLLRFHKQYIDLSNKNLMVSEYIPAPSVDELLSEGKFKYKDLLNLFYIQGFYIFVAGRFHGDLHPGNVLFDGQKFYFVDTAFVGEVGDRIRKGLFFFFEALSRYDYPECAKYLNEMAEKRIEGKEFEEFKKKFMKIYSDYTNTTVSEKSLTKQMMLTIKLGVNSGMEFEKGIFAVIRSLMYMDGMVLKANPNAKLVEDMRQFINAYKNSI